MGDVRCGIEGFREAEGIGTRHRRATRPPRLKAKPMAGRHGNAEKRRDGAFS
jgi:hypothetical protein